MAPWCRRRLSWSIVESSPAILLGTEKRRAVIVRDVFYVIAMASEVAAAGKNLKLQHILVDCPAIPGWAHLSIRGYVLGK